MYKKMFVYDSLNFGKCDHYEVVGVLLKFMDEDSTY